MSVNLIPVPEAEADTSWGINRIFHGTSAESCQYILNGEVPRPLVEQAKSFLAIFDLSWQEIQADPDFGSMWYYMFNMSRDGKMSCADRFKLARSYSLRAPEWKWYLFQAIHPRLGETDFPDDWQAMARNYFLKEQNPQVLVIHTPFDNEVIDPAFERLVNGSEVLLPMPWPEGVFVEGIAEIERTSVA